MCYNKQPEVVARYNAFIDFLKQEGFERKVHWWHKSHFHRVPYMSEYFKEVWVQIWSYDLVTIKCVGFISEPEEEIVFRGEIYSLDQLKLILKLTTGYDSQTAE